MDTATQLFGDGFGGSADPVATPNQIVVLVAKLDHAVDQGLAPGVEIVGHFHLYRGDRIEKLITEPQPFGALAIPEGPHLVIGDLKGPGTEITARLKLVEPTPQDEVRFLQYFLGVGLIRQQSQDKHAYPPLVPSDQFDE